MAKATVEVIEVMRPVRTRKIILELTENEAKALLKVSEFIAGSPERSARGYTDNIGSSIAAALGYVGRYECFTAEVRNNPLFAFDSKQYTHGLRFAEQSAEIPE